MQYIYTSKVSDTTKEDNATEHTCEYLYLNTFIPMYISATVSLNTEPLPLTECARTHVCVRACRTMAAARDAPLYLGFDFSTQQVNSPDCLFPFSHLLTCVRRCGSGALWVSDAACQDSLSSPEVLCTNFYLPYCVYFCLISTRIRSTRR